MRITGAVDALTVAALMKALAKGKRRSIGVCGCRSQGPRFSSGSALLALPGWNQEDAADQSGQRASRQTWRQHKPANGLASSIVPAGHRSADRRNPRFLLVRFYGSEVVVRSSMLRIIRVCLRHGCAFCSVALSRQCPVAAKRCARKAQGLTAQVRTEQSSGVPRCVPAHDSVPS
jgi:hypothetical protein